VSARGASTATEIKGLQPVDKSVGNSSKKRDVENCMRHDEARSCVKQTNYRSKSITWEFILNDIEKTSAQNITPGPCA
jgi:hypothetical protein